MTRHGFGRSERKSLTFVQLLRIFPVADSAEHWFEKQRWPGGPSYPHCGGMLTASGTYSTIGWRCKDFRKLFSAQKGTVMKSSKLEFQAWALVHMDFTSLTQQP